jgi:simple sugar transport system permease protein
MMMNEESKSAANGAVPPAALNIRETAIKYGFLVLLAGMVLYFSLVTGGFASPQSAVFILQSVSITGILALGVTATLVVGGFDLRSALLPHAMMASSYVMVVMGGDALTATLVCLAVGMIVGLINGIIIVYMRTGSLGDARHDVPAARPPAHSDRGAFDRRGHDLPTVRPRQAPSARPSWRSVATVSI